MAIDGLVVDALNEEDHDKGAIMQNVGQILGPFISSNIFILGSNPEWCQRNLGISEPIFE